MDTPPLPLTPDGPEFDDFEPDYASAELPAVHAPDSRPAARRMPRTLTTAVLAAVLVLVGGLAGLAANGGVVVNLGNARAADALATDTPTPLTVPTSTPTQPAATATPAPQPTATPIPPAPVAVTFTCASATSNGQDAGIFRASLCVATTPALPGGSMAVDIADCHGATGQSVGIVLDGAGQANISGFTFASTCTSPFTVTYTARSTTTGHSMSGSASVTVSG